MKKYIEILVITLAIVLAGIGGYFLGSTRSKNTKPVVSVPADSSSAGMDAVAPAGSGSAEDVQAENLKKNFCLPEARNLPSGCSRLNLLVCAHRFAKDCSGSTCMITATSPCWACNDPTVEYWTEGRCQ